MAGEYEKLELLGSGSFGKAWLVSCSKKRRHAVLKEIRIDSLSEKEMGQTLVEVKILAKCRHVNIVSYYDAFVRTGSLHIVMEYADNGDLQKQIVNQRGTLFSKEVILDWFIQICFALKYLHSENILHRDLKPQNLFLTSDGVVKVGDFGISRMLHDSADHAKTAIGTPYYLSPEICLRRPYNFKSDMWAAGCVLYELCCLRVPFHASSFPLLVLKITEGCFEPIPSEHGAVLEDLVNVLLHSEPAKRPSAEQVLRVPALQRQVKVTFRKCVGHRQRRESERALFRDLVSSPSAAKLNGGSDRPETSQQYTVKNPVLRKLSAATPKLRTALKRQRPVQSAEALEPVKRQRKGWNPPMLNLHEMMVKAAKEESGFLSDSSPLDETAPSDPAVDSEYPEVFAEDRHEFQQQDCEDIASKPFVAVSKTPANRSDGRPTHQQQVCEDVVSKAKKPFACEDTAAKAKEPSAAISKTLAKSEDPKSRGVANTQTCGCSDRANAHVRSCNRANAHICSCSYEDQVYYGAVRESGNQIKERELNLKCMCGDARAKCEKSNCMCGDAKAKCEKPNCVRCKPHCMCADARAKCDKPHCVCCKPHCRCGDAKAKCEKLNCMRCKPHCLCADTKAKCDKPHCMCGDARTKCLVSSAEKKSRELERLCPSSHQNSPSKLISSAEKRRNLKISGDRMTRSPFSSPSAEKKSRNLKISGDRKAHSPFSSPSRLVSSAEKMSRNLKISGDGKVHSPDNSPSRVLSSAEKKEKLCPSSHQNSPSKLISSAEKISRNLKISGDGKVHSPYNSPSRVLSSAEKKEKWCPSSHQNSPSKLISSAEKMSKNLKISGDRKVDSPISSPSRVLSSAEKKGRELEKCGTSSQQNSPSKLFTSAEKMSKNVKISGDRMPHSPFSSPSAKKNSRNLKILGDRMAHSPSSSPCTRLVSCAEKKIRELEKFCTSSRSSSHAETYSLPHRVATPEKETKCEKCRSEENVERCALEALYRAASLSHTDKHSAQRVLSRFLINHLGSELSLHLCSKVTSALHSGEDYSVVEKSMSESFKSYFPIIFQLLIFSGMSAANSRV